MREEVHRGIFPAVPSGEGDFHSRALSVLKQRLDLCGERRRGLEPRVEREPKNEIFHGTYQECADLILIYDCLKRKSSRYAVPVELKTISRGTLSPKARLKAETQLLFGTTYIFREYGEIVPHVNYGIIVTVSQDGAYEWERVYLDRLVINLEPDLERKRKQRREWFVNSRQF